MSRLLSSSSDMSGGKMRADLPKRSWKGVKPVEALTVFIMSKRTFGRARTQPFLIAFDCKSDALDHRLVRSFAGSVGFGMVCTRHL